MASDEEIMRRMIVELQILQETAQTLQTRIRVIEAAITEYQMANSTLNGLKEEKRGSQLLVPIGGKSYIKAQLADPKKIIFGIGANIATEKKLEEAQESLEERTVEFQKTRSALQQQFNEVTSRINDTQDKIRSMAQPGREGSVRKA